MFFDKEFGTIKNAKVTLKVKSDAVLKFCRACPLPYALKGQVEKELDCLVTKGILEPISHSEWAAPIVPIVKPDNGAFICGDYKLSMNKASKCDKYPVPRTEDLFTSLGGDEKFTEFDLSHAYQQLLLNPESRSDLTIYTHKGPFQQTQLQYGVNFASGIFQREIENLLKSLIFVKVRSNVMLVSGKNNEEHLKTLEFALQISFENELKLKLQKCVFMQPEVTYLGHRVNKDDSFPLPEKS